jgi:hypothetical protein
VLRNLDSTLCGQRVVSTNANPSVTKEDFRGLLSRFVPPFSQSLAASGSARFLSSP